MIEPKEFYRTYQADDGLATLNKKLVDEILRHNPNHVFEFGTGTGKNLKLLQRVEASYAKSGTAVVGLDISLINTITATVKNELPCIIHGDENYLRHLCNFDVVFTCSVLDHIEDVIGIIQELKRIANVAVIIAECTEPDKKNYYYKHDFESFGFERINDSEYYSEADGHTYHIYKWMKPSELPSEPKVNDDLAT
jgi:SAM-dependent methyltransferase